MKLDRVALVVCLISIVLQLAASAHPNLQDAMWVQFEPQLVRVAVNVSLKELTVAQGVGSDALGLAAERHGEYVLLHHVRRAVAEAGDFLTGLCCRIYGKLTILPALQDATLTMEI